MPKISYLCPQINACMPVTLTLLLTAFLAAAPPDTLPEARLTVYRERQILPPTDSISAERLRNAGGLADALRGFSGLQVKDYGGVGGLKTVNVRSLGSEHTAVFIDGVAVEHAQNMQVDLGRFSTDNLRSVSLHAGGRSAALQTAREYGSAASVHLASAAPERNATRIRLRGGAFGTVSPSLRAERKGRRISRVISAEALYTTGRYRFHNDDAGYDTVLVRDNGDVRALRAEAQLSGQGRGQWNVHAYSYLSERGLPGAVVRRAGVFPLCKDRQADRSFFLQGGWRGDLGSRYSLAVRAKYAYDRLRYRTQPDIDPHAFPYDNTYRQQNACLSVAQLLQLSPAWRLQVATDLQYATLDANQTNFVQPRRLSVLAAAAGSYEKGPFRLGASLFLAIADDRFAAEATGPWAGEAGTRHLFSPALVFAWEPSGGFRLGGFVKRSGRMPSFNDLYYTLSGNSRLRPENAWQGDLNAAWSLSRGPWSLAARGEAYYNRVSDKIVAIPTSNAFRWSMFNIGLVDILGADAQLSLRHGGSWRWSVQARYSYQHAVDHTDPKKDSWGLQIAYIPRHSGSLSAELERRGWRLDVTAVWSGVRHSNTSTYELYRIAPYFTADARLSRSLSCLGRECTLRLQLNNLTGTQYAVVQGFPMPGFHILGVFEIVL